MNETPGGRQDVSRISRRTFIQGASLATITGPWVLRHWAEARAQEKTLVVCTWGGLYEKAHKAAFAHPFEKETGITVRYVTQPSSAKIKAQVESGNIEWDVVDSQGHHLYRAAKAKLLEPLDYRIIDKSGIHPGVIHSHGIGSIFYAMVLGYSLNAFTRENHPRTWADLYDLKKYPGRRGLFNFVYRTLENALLADGVPSDKLYPLDIDRAFRKMDPIKDHVIWWSSGAQSSDILARGEVTTMEITNGNFFYAKKKGGNVDLEWSGPALLCADMWFVLRGTPKKDLAMKYIAFATSAKPQAAFARHEPYGPVNMKAYDMIPEDVAKDLPSVPGRVEKLVLVNDEWWGQHEAEALEKFNAWRLR